MSAADARYIKETAEELELTLVHRYSGRGMLGRSCIGIELATIRDIGRVMFHLGAINQSDDVNDMTQLIYDYRHDNMGRGYIMYWPLIECPEEFLPKKPEFIGP